MYAYRCELSLMGYPATVFTLGYQYWRNKQTWRVPVKPVFKAATVAIFYPMFQHFKENLIILGVTFTPNNFEKH